MFFIDKNARLLVGQPISIRAKGNNKNWLTK